MIVRIAIAAYLIGLLVFYTEGVVTHALWVKSYFLWDKFAGGGVLVWFALAGTTKYKNLCLPVFILSCLRFVWEIISAFTGIGIVNNIAIGLLFIALTITASYLCLRSNSRVTKFLNKHLF